MPCRPTARPTAVATVLLLALSLLAAGPAAAAAAADKPVAKELKVAVEGENVTINGKTLTLPADPADLVAVLGPPDRDVVLANRILTWDALGLVAYVTKKDPAKVRQLTVALDRDPMKFWPTSTFSGTLTVDGAVVTARSTVEEINKAKAGTKFAPDEVLTAWQSIAHENVLVMLTPPAAGATPGANFSGLNVDARLAKAAAKK